MERKVCERSAGMQRVHLSGSNALLASSRTVRRQSVSFLFERTTSLAGECEYIDCSKYVNSKQKMSSQ